MKREWYIAILCIWAILILLATTDNLRVFLLNCLLLWSLFIGSKFISNKITGYLARSVIYFLLVLNVLDFIYTTFTTQTSIMHPFLVSLSLAVPWLSIAYFMVMFVRRAREL